MAGPATIRPPAGALPPPPADDAGKLGPLRVGLREDLVVTRQLVRSGARYVVHDPLSFQNHIFTVHEYRVLCALHHDRSLAATLGALQAEDVLSAADQRSFYDFVVGLHGMGLLQIPGMPVEAVYRRYEHRQKARRWSLLRMLTYHRVSLLDPDRFLGQTLPFVRWLFTGRGLALWAALMLAAAWQCAGRLPELYGQAAELLALGNLPLLWVSLVGLKVIHEFGHAYACKRFGGAVPDMGMSLVFLTPCAYIDANASWTFRRRWHRIAVALGGVYVESIVAGIFALLWAGSPAGLWHEVARNVVVLASVTTVLVNLNPLMKYDGYYVFSDALGLVNLQQRAVQLQKALAGWLALGLPRPRFGYSRGEALLYGCYAPATLANRIAMAFGVTAVLMLTWPTLGLLLGVCFAWLLIIAPVYKLFDYLWRGRRTAAVRRRARCVAVGSVLAATLVLGLLPVSASVIVRGVLDPGTRIAVRAPDSGFVDSVRVRTGDSVVANDVLCRLRNPVLDERLGEVATEIFAQSVRLDAVEIGDPTQAAALRARLEFLRARQREFEARAAALAISVPTDGVVVGRLSSLAGKFVHQGELMMELHSKHRFVRVVLGELEVVRTRLEVGATAELRWACQPGQVVRAVVREIRPSASRDVVPVELTMAAGGDIFVHPVERSAQADQPYLHVFLEVDSVPLEAAGSGLTAWVRLQARTETLGGWLQHRFLSFLNRWRLG
ncbi:MAG TPA: hypothetical protein VK348_10235 [Planctomycetota bacterium]|nr:hypothetical protein [Planctomycetota bacterium]